MPAASKKDSATMGVARHGRLRRRTPVRSVVTGILTVAAVAVAATTSVAAIAVWDVTSKAQPTVQILDAHGKAVPKAPALTAQSGAVNMLLVSTDTRTGQGAMFADRLDQKASSGVGNNDVNLLLHIAADHKSMAVVSFPRDLEIPIPACANDSGETTPSSTQAMLNTALSRGGEKLGVSCAVSTISALTGVRIDYAAKITFLGTIAMSDAIGGVSVCLATPVVDNDVTPALNLPAGPSVNLAGAEAMAFLRSRHGVGDRSDLGRVSNQQTFMSAMMRQMVSKGTLTDPAKLFKVATAASENVTLSSSLDATTLAKIGLAVKSIGLSNMTFLSYPVIDDPEASGRVLPDPAAAPQVNAALNTTQALRLAPGSLGRAAEAAPGSGSSGASSSSGTSSSGAAGTSSGSSPSGSSPSGSATPSTAPTTLPRSVTGQSADQQTCAKKG